MPVDKPGLYEYPGGFFPKGIFYYAGELDREKGKIRFIVYDLHGSIIKFLEDSPMFYKSHLIADPKKYINDLREKANSLLGNDLREKANSLFGLAKEIENLSKEFEII